MCGIFSLYRKNNQDVIQELINGISSLEYRGYDSCGISYLKGNKTYTHKTVGTNKDLLKKIQNESFSKIGLAHTRWSTVGKITEKNTHPHNYKGISIVHNGTIQNLHEIEELLISNDYNLAGHQTDSSLIPIVIDYFMKHKSYDFLKAFYSTVRLIKSSTAIVAMSEKEPDTLLASAQDASLLLTTDQGGSFDITSDIIASKFNYSYRLLNDKIVQISNDKAQIVEQKKGKFIYHDVEFSKIEQKNAKKNLTEDNWMIQEIKEQPEVFSHILENYTKDGLPFFAVLKKIKLKKIEKVIFIACGSSYNAANYIKSIMNDITNVEIQTFIGSEFSKNQININNIKKTLFVFITQSGETTDILLSIKKVTAMKVKQKNILGIVNSPNSIITSLVDNIIYCLSGSERSVAATKSLTSQIIILKLFALHLSYLQKNNKNEIKNKIKDLHEIIDISKKIINEHENLNSIAKFISKYHNMILIGNNHSMSLTAEASLKIKEVLYKHTESIAAGELKHGHIALIDKLCLSIAFLHNKNKKTITTAINEILSRHGSVVVLTINSENNKKILDKKNIKAILLPETKDETVFYISSIIMIQLIVNKIAKIEKKNIDMPRNLAKSITVE